MMPVGMVDGNEIAMHSFVAVFFAAAGFGTFFITGGGNGGEAFATEAGSAAFTVFLFFLSLAVFRLDA